MGTSWKKLEIIKIDLKKRPKAGRRLWLWPVEHCPVTARLSFAFEKEVTNFLLISLAFCRIISAVKFRLSRRDFPQRLFSSPQSEVHSVAFSNRLAGARPTVVCNQVTKRLRQQSKLISVTNYLKSQSSNIVKSNNFRCWPLISLIFCTTPIVTTQVARRYLDDI